MNHSKRKTLISLRHINCSDTNNCEIRTLKSAILMDAVVAAESVANKRLRTTDLDHCAPVRLPTISARRPRPRSAIITRVNPSQRPIGITGKKVPSGGGAEGSHGERLLTVSAATRLQWILVPAPPSERLITYRLDRAVVIDRDAVHARSADAHAYPATCLAGQH